MLLDDLSTYLTSAGVAAAIQKGSMQELPNTALALRETGGFPTEHVLTAQAAVLDQPTVQVVTRAADYLTAMTVARQAYAALDGARDYVVGGEQRFAMVRAMQPPFFLARDDNHRFLCAFNVHVQRQSSVA